METVERVGYSLIGRFQRIYSSDITLLLNWIELQQFHLFLIAN